MGRPINKRYFGQPEAGTNQIKVRFHDGTSEVAGWIVSQRSSKRFRVTDGTTTTTCLLVDKSPGSLASGEMSISVKDDATNVKQILKIAAHKVTVDTGEASGWDFSDSAADGLVEMPEAGDPTNNITAGNFVVGVEYKIVTTGTTDFTAIGAANSDPGTIFTATGAGTGTGTAISTADDEGDSF